MPLTVNRLRHGKTVCRLIGAVVLSLMLGQWTVLVHAIEHAHAPVTVSGADDADHAWGHHAGSLECRLLDQLLQGQAPGAELAAVAGLPPAASPWVPAASSIGPVAAARVYEARGPPRG